MNIQDETITCCNSDCGIPFQVPYWWAYGKRSNHSWFYCPNGHRQRFHGESDLEKARRERDIYKQQVARAEDEARLSRQNEAVAVKKVKKLERRAKAGTCPCCQRTFSNMTRHMKSKHPSFGADNVVPLKAG